MRFPDIFSFYRSAAECLECDLNSPITKVWVVANAPTRIAEEDKDEYYSIIYRCARERASNRLLFGNWIFQRAGLTNDTSIILLISNSSFYRTSNNNRAQMAPMLMA